MKPRVEYLKALGPLAPLFTDPEVTEIMVDSPEHILVEIEGQLQEADVRLDSRAEILGVIQALSALSDQMPGPEQTILEFAFPEGEARGLAVLPPTSTSPLIVIRKMLRIARITWDKLVEWGSVTEECLDFLRQAVRAPVNILVAGGTGSGKTTITSRVVDLIPSEQRIIMVESMPEIQANHPHIITLQGGGPANLSVPELIQTATKMRPDWLIIGEMLGAEAMKTVEVFGRGYSGITNIHAESVEDALMRLEALCLTASLGLGLGEIRNLVAAAFQLVLYQRRMPDGRRKIVEIVELCGQEAGRYRLERLFRFNPETNRLEATGVRPSWEC